MIYWDWNNEREWEGFYGREPIGSVVGYWIGAGVEFYAYSPNGDNIGDGKPFPTLAEAKASVEHDAANRPGGSANAESVPSKNAENTGLGGQG